MHAVRQTPLVRQPVPFEQQKVQKLQLRRIQSKADSIQKKSDSESDNVGF